ncbi:hypothetical protein CYR55_22375 [Chimaeribacter californicus]|uniref:Uncharacterized protein n=1 Tax=Chimaeribacter californicus TaxID=2060067 RepID=A0A2N5DU05_9GAMM|nr:hypothetical protein CYR55_22375 [Chimaeribacter californicus]
MAAKAAAKTALRAVPIVGQVLGVGYDAVTGWQNKDGQAKAFDLKEGQEATKRQKAEYTAANIADMGGLVSGGAGLLASGASKLGLGGVAKSLTFSTEDMAKGLDNKISSAKNLATSLSSALGLGALGFSEQAKAEKAADERTTDVVDAVKTGATATTQALSDLAKAFESGSLLKAAANKAEEAAQTVVDFGARTYANIAQPATDAVSPELNIGGSNAKARSFRNNNFGNLQYAGQKGARLENANAYGERRFARFDTPEEGFRSLANQLSSYANGTSSVVGYKKLQSIGEIIPSFAPESENNTKAYMASLSKQLGVGLNDKLDLQNPEVMTKVMRAIATLEGGNPQVTDEFIKNSIGHYQEGSGNKGRGQWVGQFNDSTLPIINQKRQQLGLAPVTKYDQYAGIASVNGKAVDSSLPLASMAALPAAGGQVVQHAQSVKKPGDTASHAISRGGIDYRPATLPMDGTAARAVVDKIGADELRHTEGLRHQVYVASEAESPPESKKIVDAAKEAKAAQVGQVAAARPTGAATVNAGVSFRSAKLGSDDGSVWNTVAKKLGAEHVLNAEGLRHQVNPVDENAASAGRASLSAAAISRPGMAIPVRMPTIQDLSASNVQPTVNVANPQPAFPKEASALLKKINETLEEIRGHTKDAAEKAGDQAPKANTPQPAPRGSVPLSINDPLMASVAGN